MSSEITVGTIAPAQPGEPAAEPRSGLLLAFSAYALWGLLPLVLKAVAHVPSLEVLAHRAIWSVPIAGATLLALGRTSDVRKAFTSPRMLGMAMLTAAIISVNWGVYVWAIASGRTIEAALGYYINPLVSIAMGAVILRERLNRFQIAAVALATLVVAMLTVEAGGVPWVSLVLAFSFAIYGFLRKTLPIGPSQGFFLETLILSIPALAFVIWLEANGRAHFATTGLSDSLWLVACGPATAIPLLLYAFGAKLLRISTLGILQYIAPTLVFLIAIFVFKEPFGAVQAVAFVVLWIALAIYTWPIIAASRRKRATRIAP